MSDWGETHRSRLLWLGGDPDLPDEDTVAIAAALAEIDRLTKANEAALALADQWDAAAPPNYARLLREAMLRGLP